MAGAALVVRGRMRDVDVAMQVERISRRDAWRAV